MDHSYLTEEQVISDTAVQIRDLPAKGRTYMNKLAEIEAALSTMDIKLKKEKKSACSGGYSESLREFVQDEVVFNGYVYHCDGDSGTLHVGNGDLSSVFKDVVPESVDSLINETKKYETEI